MFRLAKLLIVGGGLAAGLIATWVVADRDLKRLRGGKRRVVPRRRSSRSTYHIQPAQERY